LLACRAIAEEIESVGGYLNAATGYQRTGYYARVLKSDVATAADILTDILADPLFEDTELEKEKEVVVQEIGEAWDTPDDAVHEMLQAAAFKGQPLGRSILGSESSVRGHSRQSLRLFMGRLYKPDNMLVAAAGAVDEDVVAGLFEKRFGKDVAVADLPSRANPHYVGGVARDERDIEQTHIALAFPGAGLRHDDYFATRVFAEALGGGMASRLFQTIREERGLAYSVYAYADCYDEAGVVGAYVGTDEGNARESIELVRTEMSALAEAVTPEELARARAVLKSSLLMALETPMGRIENAAGQIFAFGDVLSVSQIGERIDSIGAHDVMRCAERALHSGPPSLSVVGPGDFDRLRSAAQAG
jgi:predicted Zn-dependent peptidase